MNNKQKAIEELQHQLTLAKDGIATQVLGETDMADGTHGLYAVTTNQAMTELHIEWVEKDELEFEYANHHISDEDINLILTSIA